MITALIVGSVLSYLAIGILIAVLLGKYTDWDLEKNGFESLFMDFEGNGVAIPILFWPLMIVFGICYQIGHGIGQIPRKIVETGKSKHRG